MHELNEMLKKVNTFIFDYDGVMTDGTVYMDSNGDQIGRAHV